MPEIITSRQNPLVQFAASLQTKKGREEAGAFPAEGEKLFREAICARADILRVFISEERREAFLPLVTRDLGDDGRVVILSTSAFSKISSEKAPQGIITVIKSLDISKNYIKIDKKDILSFGNDRILALSSVRDPGNLGAILRSAAAFGFRRLLVSADCAELTNPKTVRAAMGAIFKTGISVIEDFDSLPTAAREAGRRVFCAELTGKAVPLDQAGLRRSDIVIIGNEGHGIPPGLSAKADGSVYIPIGVDTESLNAAVAASIFLWEIGRKD